MMRIFQATGGNFTLLILMFGVMFLFLILPQQRRAKRERKFKNELKKGDLIVTKGGIHGKVIEVNDSLEDAPESCNNSPYDSWIIKIKVSNPSQVDELLDSSSYQNLCQ